MWVQSLRARVDWTRDGGRVRTVILGSACDSCQAQHPRPAPVCAAVCRLERQCAAHLPARQLAAIVPRSGHLCVVLLVNCIASVCVGAATSNLPAPHWRAKQLCIDRGCSVPAIAPTPPPPHHGVATYKPAISRIFLASGTPRDIEEKETTDRSVVRMRPPLTPLQPCRHSAYLCFWATVGVRGPHTGRIPMKIGC